MKSFFSQFAKFTGRLQRQTMPILLGIGLCLSLTVSSAFAADSTDVANLNLQLRKDQSTLSIAQNNLATDQRSLTADQQKLTADQQSLVAHQQSLSAAQQALSTATTAQDQAAKTAAVNAAAAQVNADNTTIANDSNNINNDNIAISNDSATIAAANLAITADQNNLNAVTQAVAATASNSGNSTPFLQKVLTEGLFTALVGHPSASGSVSASDPTTGAGFSLGAGVSFGGGGGGGLGGGSGSGSGNTLGDIFCNVYGNLAYFIDLYDYISYVMGAFLIALGVHGLSKHFEAPSNNHIHTQILRLSAGAFMLCLPSVMGVLVHSVFFSSSGGGLSVCTAGDAAAAGTTLTLDVMLENAVSNLQGPFLALMSLIANVVGLYFILHGLYTGARHGYDPRTHSPTKIVANLFVGTLLVAVGSSYDVFADTIFGGGDSNSIGSGASVTNWTMVTNLTTDPTAQAHIQGAIRAALTVVQWVGIIAFIRGFMIMKKAAEGSGQATMPQGLTHVIGGVLAINIYQFLTAMQTTFGTTFF